MRLLLVEDDKHLGKATAEGLKETYAVDWVRSSEEADDALATTSYALIVLDINLPGASGLELLKKLRKNHDQIPVLLLTARDAVRHRVEGLNAGADDYLVKPFELAELTARMRAVHRRGNAATPTPLIFGPLVLDAEGRLAELDGDALTLTGREWDILEALVLADGRTVARERLQGDGSSNALEVYVSRLRPRLESAGVLIRTVRGFGYRLEQLK